MGKSLTLILGGARSGKSSHAHKVAHERGGDNVLFVATAQALDGEMATRIETHRRERPLTWHTLEAPRHAGGEIARAASHAIVLVDCLTLLVSNAMLSLPESASAAEAEAAALAEVEELIAAYRDGTASWIIISNEVGSGVVPPYPMGRAYRDALGRANQRLASAADEVVLMVAGIPLKVR